MLSRGGNYWMAWADLTFLLFIAAMSFSAAQQARVREAEAHAVEADARAKLAEERRAVLALELESIRKKSNPCAEAEMFLTDLSSCVRQRVRSAAAEQRKGCFVTIGEDVVQFYRDSAVAVNRDAADAVAACVYDAAFRFQKARPLVFRAISIYIDGHTDCEGPESRNEALGAERALSLYDRVLQRAYVDGRWSSSSDRGSFMSRIAIRSMGEARPTLHSRCTEETGWEADRRVVVSVQLATETGELRPGGE